MRNLAADANGRNRHRTGPDGAEDTVDLTTNGDAVAVGAGGSDPDPADGASEATTA